MSTKELPNNLFEGNEWVLPSSFDMIPLVTDELEKRWLASGWDKGNSSDYENPIPAMLDGLSDALDNAIVHGSFGIEEKDPEESWRSAIKRLNLKTDKKIKIRVDIYSDKTEITIQDEGKGFDPATVPDPTSLENILKGSGRGLLFMRSAYDEVIFNKENKTVTLINNKKSP